MQNHGSADWRHVVSNTVFIVTYSKAKLG